MQTISKITKTTEENKEDSPDSRHNERESNPIKDLVEEFIVECSKLKNIEFNIDNIEFNTDKLSAKLKNKEIDREIKVIVDYCNKILEIFTKALTIFKSQGDATTVYTDITEQIQLFRYVYGNPNRTKDMIKKKLLYIYTNNREYIQVTNINQITENSKNTQTERQPLTLKKRNSFEKAREKQYPKVFCKSLHFPSVKFLIKKEKPEAWKEVDLITYKPLIVKIYKENNSDMLNDTITALSDLSDIPKKTIIKQHLFTNKELTEKAEIERYLESTNKFICNNDVYFDILSFLSIAITEGYYDRMLGIFSKIINNKSIINKKTIKDIKYETNKVGLSFKIVTAIGPSTCYFLGEKILNFSSMKTINYFKKEISIQNDMSIQEGGSNDMSMRKGGSNDIMIFNVSTKSNGEIELLANSIENKAYFEESVENGSNLIESVYKNINTQCNKSLDNGTSKSKASINIQPINGNDNNKEETGTVIDDNNKEETGTVIDDNNKEETGTVIDDNNKEETGTVIDDNNKEETGTVIDDNNKEETGTVIDDNNKEETGTVIDDNKKPKNVNYLLGYSIFLGIIIVCIINMVMLAILDIINNPIAELFSIKSNDFIKHLTLAIFLTVFLFPLLPIVSICVHKKRKEITPITNTPAIGADSNKIYTNKLITFSVFIGMSATSISFMTVFTVHFALDRNKKILDILKEEDNTIKFTAFIAIFLVLFIALIISSIYTHKEKNEISNELSKIAGVTPITATKHSNKHIT